MKNLKFLSILTAVVISFISCEEDESAKVNFEIIVTGESPNAIVQLNNTSDEADLFEWQFSEGAGIETSAEANPQITVDKVGEFTVTLTATTGTSEKTKTKTVNITGVNGINSYDDVKIGYLFSEDFGTYFSCTSGNVYLDDLVNRQNTDKVDLWFYYKYHIEVGSPLFAYLRSMPSFNLNANDEISVTDFDNLLQDRFDANLDYPEYAVDLELDEIPKVIPFKSSDGKIGLVKIQELYPGYFLMDVKVKKYF
jgi:hypothetical protein